MDLFLFQSAAAGQIAERFGAYAANPLMVDRTRSVPFFQILVSITGSGKTLILADAVAQMQARLPMQPVVLWLPRVGSSSGRPTRTSPMASTRPTSPAST